MLFCFTFFLETDFLLIESLKNHFNLYLDIYF